MVYVCNRAWTRTPCATEVALPLLFQTTQELAVTTHDDRVPLESNMNDVENLIRDVTVQDYRKRTSSRYHDVAEAIRACAAFRMSINGVTR